MSWKLKEKMDRLLAQEQGAVRKDWGGRVAFALVYPNTYAGRQAYLDQSKAYIDAVYKDVNRYFNLLPKAKLDAAKTAEVKKLRADGERLHKEGKHTESMDALGKAKGILGIK